MNDTFIFLFLLVAFVFLVIKTKKLTLSAAIVAALIGCIIFLGTGFPGLVLLGSFFIIGTAATSWQKNKKSSGKYFEPLQRDTGQVLANGGISAVLSLIALLSPSSTEMYLLLIACSLSSATADTVSSELGVVYGKRFYNILSFKKDEKGENGVISLEGTIAGILGSAVIAVIYSSLKERFDEPVILIIIIAGTAGNLFDSVLGASLERRSQMSNNAVNFLNTIFGAVTGWILSEILL